MDTTGTEGGQEEIPPEDLSAADIIIITPVAPQTSTLSNFLSVLSGLIKIKETFFFPKVVLYTVNVVKMKV